MENTKIYLVLEFRMIGYFYSQVFFLNKEEAEYYCYLKNKESKENIFSPVYFSVKEVEAGGISKDKDFEKFRKEQKEKEIQSIKEEIIKKKECEIKDKEQVEKLESQLKTLTK